MTSSFHAARDFSFKADGPTLPLPRIIKTTDDLDLWRREAAAATLQVGDLEAQRRRILSSASVEEIRQHDDLIASARVREERAAAVITDGEASIAERAERERAAQPERRRKHAAAAKARDEAERIVREVYGPAAQTIADALTRLAGLEAVIDAAGPAPDGESRIPSYEAFRHPPEAGCAYHAALSKTVVLPPVVRTEPDFWPSRH